MNPLQEQADPLFDELSAILRHAPDDPKQALHTWMREGNPLPQPWNDRTQQLR